MIEFKAECGHTVRAKDEDAGGSVRCSYCGRTAAVPDNVGNDLDFLFEDEEQLIPQGMSAARGKPPKPSRLFARRKRKPGDFNPFPVILNLCYAAILISVVIVVGKQFVLPLFEEGGLSHRAAQGSAKPPSRKPRERREGKQNHNPRPGLLARDQLSGLYVSSTPPGASVFYVASSDAHATGRIRAARGSHQFRANTGTFPRLRDGTYTVEVVFAWNDEKLTGYGRYRQFRHAIERATDQQRRHLVRSYFLPDEATDVFVDDTGEQIYIVRQYRKVVVRNNRSAGVRALFLPRILKPDGVSFSIEELVTNYLPTTPAYSFSKGHVRNELQYYGVSQADQTFILDALERIGVIPYATSDGETRLFKIGIEEGMFAAPMIHETKP